MKLRRALVVWRRFEQHKLFCTVPTQRQGSILAEFFTRIHFPGETRRDAASKVEFFQLERRPSNLTRGTVKLIFAWPPALSIDGDAGHPDVSDEVSICDYRWTLSVNLLRFKNSSRSGVNAALQLSFIRTGCYTRSVWILCFLNWTSWQTLLTWMAAQTDSIKISVSFFSLCVLSIFSNYGVLWCKCNFELINASQLIYWWNNIGFIMPLNLVYTAFHCDTLDD